jgi:hypothetical protein
MLSGKLALGISAAIALLAGCASGSSLEPTSGPAQASLRSKIGQRDGVVSHRNVGRSWMAPEAKSEDLIYVSDLLAQVVDIYTYGRGNKLVGMLTGFFNPEGLCVDNVGNVWVVNDTSGGVHQITEYAHAGTTPIQNLINPNGNVNGCSVDQKSGDLAVTNFWGPTEGAGGISIYRHGTGSPISYTDPSIHYYYYCGYDTKGNLFVDGLSSASSFGFAELPKGKSTFTDITLNETIYLPGGVQWDGKYIAVGDQVAVKRNFTSTIYQFSISGQTGTEVGFTLLTGSKQVAQFWLPKIGRGKKNPEGTTVIGPNQNGADTVFWPYPAGGSPTKTIPGETDPIGATLSLAKM